MVPHPVRVDLPSGRSTSPLAHTDSFPSRSFVRLPNIAAYAGGLTLQPLIRYALSVVVGVIVRDYASPKSRYVWRGHIFPYARRFDGAFVLILFALTACASRHIVDGFLVDKARGFRIPILRDGWRQLEAEGAELAFQAEPGGQVAALFVSCEERQATPLRILARQLFFGISPKRVVSQQMITLNGTDAIHTVLTGHLRATDVMVSSYVAKDDRCAYDLVYVASPEAFQDRLPEFERFVQGWTLTENTPGRGTERQ